MRLWDSACEVAVNYNIIIVTFTAIHSCSWLKWLNHHTESSVSCFVLKFSEPAASSYRLSNTALGECFISGQYGENVWLLLHYKRHTSVRSSVWSLLPQRESGLQVFQVFINKLDAEAKHKFFRWEKQFQLQLQFLSRCEINAHYTAIYRLL